MQIESPPGSRQSARHNPEITSQTHQPTVLRTLQWYGGEPLLAVKQIEALSRELISLCAAKSVNFRASMITNGVNLKLTTMKLLLDCSVMKYQVTIDGPEAVHNSRRATKSGKNTFHIILKNIKDICADQSILEKCPHIAIRVNIDKYNVLEARSLIDELSENIVNKQIVSLNFSPVTDWGKNGASKRSLGHDDFSDVEIDLLLYAAKAGFRLPDLLPQRTTRPCMAVHPESEVYDASGNIYPCYEFPYTDAYADARYKVGHLDSVIGTGNEQAVTRQWLHEAGGSLSPCDKCNLYPVCAGGCPKKWLDGESGCPPFKKNISKRLPIAYIARKGNISEFIQQ